MNRTDVALLVLHFGLCALFLTNACTPRRAVIIEKRPPPPEQEVKKEEEIEKREAKVVQYGIASWYGDEFHGRPTSSGEIYDMHQLTCAHNTFPLGTMVMVTNLENGRSIELKVNDRGPFVKERIIDLSYAAAKILGMWEQGTARVKVEGIGPLIEKVRFTLQVGSFTDEFKARSLADRLRRDFEDVHIATVETPTQKYHRVRIGRFDTRESAMGVAQTLSKMGYQVLLTSR